MSTREQAQVKDAPAPAQSFSSTHTGLLQRKCACGGMPGLTGECAECSRKRLATQARSMTQAGPSGVPPIVHEVLNSPGRPLDAATRAFMEPRFGHDFGRVRVVHPRTIPVDLTVGSTNDPYEQDADRGAQHIMRMPRSDSLEHRAAGSGRDFGGVRVHTDAKAAESARAINALAYTAVPDIIFGAGQYAPETADGRRLIAHELAHVLQQSSSSGPGLVVQRRLLSRTADEIHDPLIEAYRRAHGLPPGGVDPTTSKQVGPTDAELKYGGELDRWIRQGEVPAPLTKPDLSPVQGPFDEAACGSVKPGITQAAETTRIAACVHHTRFVNIMNQSISNMRQVESPYAPGLAALYDTLLQQVINEGQSNPPTATSPKSYTVKDITVAVSSGTSLKIPSFTLKLEQVLNGDNGSYGFYGLTLNESSSDALLDNRTGVERTMYHEGFHFLSGEISAANRAARTSSPPGNVVRRELDYRLVEPFHSKFEAAVAPLWTEALSTIGGVAAADLPTELGPQIALHWYKVNNEILSRVEEVVYLELREGRGFGPVELQSFPQRWIRTADYWPSAYISNDDMQTFLTSKRAEIEADVLPVIQEIQKAYLYMRPVR